MPLLMTSESENLPDETTVEIPGNEARAIFVYRGQLLSITDINGKQPATLFAFLQRDFREFLSPHHTRVFSNSYILSLGMRLMTNRRRPIMVLGRDTVGTHDLLLPATDKSYLSKLGMSKSNGCVENALAALKDVGVSPPKLPDPVNLFLNVALDKDGTLTPKKLKSKKGDQVLFRVLLNSICVVSSVNKSIGLWSEGKSTPLLLNTFNFVPSFD
jgi:uncharacterized protein YcgI (DUF1989 family)